MSRNFSPSLEGARGVAALTVLGFHAVVFTDHSGFLGIATSRLWLGVPLFFLLSGFLLFRPMAHATIFLEERPSFVRYARSRVLRIIPAYWVALTVTILLLYYDARSMVPAAAALVLLVRYLWTGRGLVAALLLAGIAFWALHTAPPEMIRFGFMNYFLVFLLYQQNGMIGPAWTLCIEAAFYVFLPLLVLGADMWARRGATVRDRASRLAVVLCCLLPVGSVYLTYSGDSRTLPIWLPGYIDQFAIGMLLAVAVEVWPRVSVRRSRSLLALGVAVGVVVNLGAYHLGAPSPYGNGSASMFATGMDVAFALALASVLMRGERTVLGRVLSARPLVAAGTISYGIYLWHMLVILGLDDTGAWGNAWSNVILVLAGTVMIATASWFVVEKPALRLKDRSFFSSARARPATVPVGAHPSGAD
jgi:peptidoglycan/LPS O-acetylase OafA/YrhL